MISKDDMKSHYPKNKWHRVYNYHQPRPPSEGNFFLSNFQKKQMILPEEQNFTSFKAFLDF